MAGVRNSHQTMRLSRGRHASPEDGACVMELASMLAGERFSDNPRCVDPVVAAYLRALNDRLDQVERQKLLPYAARAVGTRGSRAQRRARVRDCLAFAGIGHPLTARPRIALLLGVRWALRIDRGAGEYAARRAIADGRTDAAFALLDRLVGREPDRVPPAAPLRSRAVRVRG